MRKVFQGLVVVSLLATCVWLRGAVIANAVGGHYPFRSFTVDCLGFAVLLLMLGLCSRAFYSASRRLCGHRKGLQLISYAAGMIIMAFPLLLVTIQLHPPRVIASATYTPAKLGLAFQDVAFHSDGLKLAGWFIPAAQADRPIVLVTHGIGANKSDFLFIARPLHEAGLNVFTFDFRAHGQSEGRTITFGLNEAHDVKAAYDWLKERHPKQSIYALGFSMGGAAVARAAGDYGIFQRIALDSAFSRFEHVAKSNRLNAFGPLSSLLWLESRCLAWLWTQRDFNDNDPALSLARRTDARLLLIHGTHDSIVPKQEAMRIKDATTRFSTLWMIEGGEHVQGHRDPNYGQTLTQFFLSPDPIGN
jgi:hypothetical protein